MGIFIGIFIPYHVSIYRITRLAYTPKKKSSIAYSSITQSISIFFKKPNYYCHLCKQAFYSRQDLDQHTHDLHKNLVEQTRENFKKNRDTAGVN